MTGTSPLTLLMRMIAALMLATIGVHAAAPASQPLERGHGSAFSASTYNVSLKSDREAATVERLAIEPVDDDTRERAPLPPVASNLAQLTPSRRAQAPLTPDHLTRISARDPPPFRT